MHASSNALQAMHSYEIPNPLIQMIKRMQCPCCQGDLLLAQSNIWCDYCKNEFPILDHIPLLAVQGSSETWTAESPADTSVEYQNQYQNLEDATHYNEAYRDKLTKRWSTEREFKLLDRLLSSQRHCDNLLNLPSGGGRLSERIALATDTLIESDIGYGQLQYARKQSEQSNSRLWMTSSAFHIPFKDNSVDAIVSVRLCHHLPTEAERERLVAELLRVASGFVIMSFFDHHSPKNYLRRLRAPFNKKPPKMTMTSARLAELAKQHGAKLVEAPALAITSSGHRYALMVKQ